MLAIYDIYHIGITVVKYGATIDEKREEKKRELQGGLAGEGTSLGAPRGFHPKISRARLIYTLWPL